jgi:hypothetical protein
MIPAAFITDEFLHFTVFIFSPGHPINFLTTQPQHHFAATLIALAMSTHGIQIPHAVSEAEVAIR